MVNILFPTSKQVSAGWEHTLCCDQQKRSQCWGRNQYYQVGDIPYALTRTPEDVKDNFADELLMDIIVVDTGDYHTCAVTELGGVRCWGNNKNGQLGNGTFSSIPGRVIGTLYFIW